MKKFAAIIVFSVVMLIANGALAMTWKASENAYLINTHECIVHYEFMYERDVADAEGLKCEILKDASKVSNVNNVTINILLETVVELTYTIDDVFYRTILTFEAF